LWTSLFTALAKIAKTEVLFLPLFDGSSENEQSKAELWARLRSEQSVCAKAPVTSPVGIYILTPHHTYIYTTERKEPTHHTQIEYNMH